jgi:hypothetical protein
VPKKHVIRLSPRPSGRPVRLTLEVSANVGAESRARVKKPAKKAKRRKAVASVPKLAGPLPSPATTPATPAAASVMATQPAVESSSPEVPVPAIQATPLRKPTGGQMAVIAGVAVLVIATIAVPRGPANDEAGARWQGEQLEQHGDAESRSPASVTPAPQAVVMAARPTVKTRALAQDPRKSSVQKAANRATEPRNPASSASLAADDYVPRADPPATPVPDPLPAVPSSTPATNLSSTTITGCLEISTDGNDFRLADIEGPDAPKSRSWRTGFLKKRTAPVALVGPPDPLALKKSVGKRVSATGLLTNRELQVHSLRVVSPSCN